MSAKKSAALPFRGELALLVSVHEVWCQAEGAQAQGALGAPADVMDEGDGLVVLALVVILVLDETDVNKVAHGSARVPPDVVGVNVDFLKVADHVVLVDDVGLGAGGGGGQGRGVVLVGAGTTVETGEVDSREWEGVGDLEEAVLVHADEGAGGSGREAGGAVLHDFHDDLYFSAC